MVGIDALTDVANALSQIFAPKLAKQWNRQAVLSSHLPVEAGRGKNVAWDVSLTDALAPALACYAEGDDVGAGEFDVDTLVPAVLSWAHYRTAFQVTETELDAAASSLGSADELIAMFQTRVEGSATKLASFINQDLWLGTGTSTGGDPSIVGLLGGSILPTGTYATIDRGVYPEFAGNVLANGGVARALTVDLLEQAWQDIFVASSEMPDVIVCDPGTLRKYKGLFETNRRFLGDEKSGNLIYDTSTPVAFFMSIPVYMDKDGYQGTLCMLNTKHVKQVYLPISPSSSEDVWKVEVKEGEGMSGEEVTPMGLPFKIVPLSKTGDSLKFMIKCVLQLKVDRPGSCCILTDINVT
jgi:hypothetical protein